MDNRQLAQYLAITLAQRERAATKATNTYGPDHVITLALEKEITDIQNFINNLKQDELQKTTTTKK